MGENTKDIKAIFWKAVEKENREEQLAYLSQAARELADRQLGGAPYEEVADGELAFHCAILEMTHNDLLMRMHHVPTVFYARAIRMGDVLPGREASQRSAWEHLAIAEAFAARNVGRARVMLAHHLAVMLIGCRRDGVGTRSENR